MGQTNERDGMDQTTEGMKDKESLSYSVIIPVYNEEGSLPELIRRTVEVMDSLEGDYELIIVDDGSQDRTSEVLLSLKEEFPRLGFLRLDGNYGQSTALIAGLRVAKGEIIITMDGDLQNDPLDIPKLLEALNGYDAVIGWRRKRRDPWIKRVSTRIANYVRNLLSMEDIRDSASGFRAFRRRCLESLIPFHGMHRFLPTLFKMQGMRVCEIPVTHYPRKHGTSKYNIKNRLFVSLVDLFGIRWMKKRRIAYNIEEERL